MFNMESERLNDLDGDTNLTAQGNASLKRRTRAHIEGFLELGHGLPLTGSCPLLLTCLFVFVFLEGPLGSLYVRG